MADELFNALHHYVDQSRTIGICSIKLILYKNVIKKELFIRHIADCFYRVDHIKIKPKNSKLDSKTIYNLMFNSFINNKEKERIIYVYKTCLKNKNPKYKIDNFQNNIKIYMIELRKVYKSYLENILPLLTDLKNHRLEEYEKIVNNTFEDTTSKKDSLDIL